MQREAPKPANFKQRAIEEFKEFWITALYLALFLSAFTFYRRMVLAEFGITYLHYGIAVLEALVIAKIVLIGRALGVEKYIDGRGPLILSVVLKAAIFAVLAILFGVLEQIVEVLLHRSDWPSVIRGVRGVGAYELLARVVMLFISFVPFFAFWEIGHVLGRGKLIELFFSTRQSPVDGHRKSIAA
jgi:hypothetical protein